MNTRDRIIHTFSELARSRGVAGLTMDELAAAGRLSKRTIYRHFRSKEEIATAALHKFLQETEQLFMQKLQECSDPVEIIRRLTRLIPERLSSFGPQALADIQVHYPRLWQQVEDFRAEKLNLLTRTLLAGSRAGAFRPVNPLIFTTALLAAVRAVLNPEFVFKNNLTMEQAFAEFFDIFLFGILQRGE
ncbi:MAG: TetR/AcrR family transcriptional regulator [Bacillota bacterium]